MTVKKPKQTLKKKHPKTKTYKQKQNKHQNKTNRNKRQQSGPKCRLLIPPPLPAKKNDLIIEKKQTNEQKTNKKSYLVSLTVASETNLRLLILSANTL